MGVLSHRNFIILDRLFAVKCHRIQWARDVSCHVIYIRLFHDSVSHRIRDCFSWLGTLVGEGLHKLSSMWDSAWACHTTNFFQTAPNFPSHGR